MRSLRNIKRRFVVLVTVLAILNLGLLAYLFRPGARITAQRNKLADLEQQSKNLKRDVAMLQGSNPAKTRADLAQLYAEHIPSRWSSISEELQKLGQQGGVRTQGVRYTTDSTDLPEVQRVKIDTTVVGDYEKVAHFINAMERDHLLFIITQVSLSEQQGGLVSVQIRFETFLKETA